ncbi:hypothetical protein [uncultured Duncaniella sp.]|uniref:hypothetical protein n=1 Tax=uncultured Duncaniella sp. TaxID=2768039 RepID=UPI0025A9463E|nr:hypothetical protein [uncultured Duncaniella sp.]
MNHKKANISEEIQIGGTNIGTPMNTYKGVHDIITTSGNSKSVSKTLYQPSALYKAICIDFFIKKYKCELITSEFRYGLSQLVTDLVIVTPRNAISIEIKTEQDDLRRLRVQIQEARKNFNLTIVFAASKFKKELLSLLPSDVGITIVEGDVCKIVRNPKRNQPIEKELIASIPAVFLRSYFNISNNLDSDRTRLYVLDKHTHRIEECFRAFLKYKFEKNYRQFLADRGNQTHMDDIPTLTMKNFIEINWD